MAITSLVREKKSNNNNVFMIIEYTQLCISTNIYLSSKKLFLNFFLTRKTFTIWPKFKLKSHRLFSTQLTNCHFFSMLFFIEESGSHFQSTCICLNETRGIPPHALAVIFETSNIFYSWTIWPHSIKKYLIYHLCATHHIFLLYSIQIVDICFLISTNVHNQQTIILNSYQICTLWSVFFPCDPRKLFMYKW